MSNHRFLLNHFMFQNISMMGLARLCVKSPCCSCSGPQFVSCTHVRSLTTRCDSSTSSHDSAMGGHAHHTYITKNLNVLLLQACTYWIWGEVRKQEEKIHTEGC